jgi:hypothetical protein
MPVPTTAPDAMSIVAMWMRRWSARRLGDGAMHASERMQL